MKKFAAVMILVMAMAGVSYSQNINWRSLGEDQRNVVQLGFGYDYAATAQFAYGRTFSWVRPVMVRLDYSFPMGEDLFDDFKVRLGGQMEIVEAGGFSATVRILANLRRYQTTLVRIVSFGSDFALLAGYYRPTWHAAGEFGFDKSITSYLKHSDVMRAHFPGIRDGWYLPTGGNYYYGIQAGKTIGESLDLSLRMGATNAQDNDANGFLPYYLRWAWD